MGAVPNSVRRNVLEFQLGGPASDKLRSMKKWPAVKETCSMIDTLG